MVLDRPDVEVAIARLDDDVCHAAVDNGFFCQPVCQRADESA